MTASPDDPTRAAHTERAERAEPDEAGAGSGEVATPAGTGGPGRHRADGRQPGRHTGRHASERAERAAGDSRDGGDTRESLDPESVGLGRRLLSGLWTGVKEIGIVVGLALLVSLVVKTFLLQPFHIPSGSMEDTLLNGDRVVVSKLTPGPFDLQRGDIVVFADPDHWLSEPPPTDSSALHRLLVFVGLAPDDSQEHLIKRVIGLPGDKVACCDANGRITVNGVAISEPYLKPGDAPNGGRPPFTITVPAGRVWVMGDHRSDSADSRLHDDGTGATGSVPIDDIRGRAILVVWPVDRFRWLSVSDSIYAGIPAATGH